MSKFFTTKEVAEKLGYADDSVVRRLITQKKIKADRLGRTWMISDEELSKLKRVRKEYKKRGS